VVTTLLVWDVEAQLLALDDSYTMSQGSTLIADGVGDNPASLCANDSGVADPADFVIRILEPPNHGELEISPEGNVIYTPNQNFVGVDRFRYALESLTSVPLLNAASEWKFLNPMDGRAPDFSDPDFDDTWPTSSYDDSLWTVGVGRMGYGEVTTTNIGIPFNGLRMTAYFRSLFSVDEGLIGRLSGSIVRDDAAILYLDGVELMRSHEAGALQLGSSRDDYFLPVEGNGTAWVSREEEGVSLPFEVQDFSLAEGEHLIAASVHNNLNPILFTSSDLQFSLDLSIFPQSSAYAEIAVVAASVPPEVEPDVFFIEGDSDFDTISRNRNIYSNDSLSNESGVLFTPIISLSINDTEDGEILTSDSSTGDFSFRPTPGFRGVTQLSYTVSTSGGVSSSVPIYLVVVDPGDSQEVVQEVFRGFAGTILSVLFPLPAGDVGDPFSLSFGGLSPNLVTDLSEVTYIFPRQVLTEEVNLPLQFGIDSVNFPMTFETISPMAAWREVHFNSAQLNDLSISSASADPDRDGLDNLVEYILGSEPLIGNNPADLLRVENTIVKPSADEFPDDLPTDVLNEIIGPSDYRVSTEFLDSIPTDTTAELQVSSDLTSDNWDTWAIRYPSFEWISNTVGVMTEPNIDIPIEDDRLFVRFKFELQSWVTDVPR